MVELSGLSTFAGGPNITTSNALPGTQFNAGSAAAGVGTGSLGEFGGYIPTPLRQFNNYQDYLSYMPGAEMMQKYAEMPTAPGIYNWDSAAYGSYLKDSSQSPYAAQTWVNAQNQLPVVQGQVQDWNAQATSAMNDANMARSHATDIWNQAADPQDALYGRTQQQLTDQTRAGLAARGLTYDPYGAGVEGSTMANFNIDWQNNLLNRKLQGAQGYAGLEGLATGEAQAGEQMQQNAYNYLMQATQMPDQMYQDYLDRQMNNLQNFGIYGEMAGQPYQQVFKNYQDIQNQFLTAQQQSFNQNQISGFEDPFSEMQLQAQIEMEREQMQEQEKAQKRQMAMQGAQAGMGAMGGMKGGI